MRRGREGEGEGKEQGTYSVWQGRNCKSTIIYLVFEGKKGKTKIMDWKTRKTKGQREKGNHRCRGKKEM